MERDRISRGIDQMIADGVLVENKNATQKFIDVSLSSCREKEENWDIQERAQEEFGWSAERVRELRWFGLEMDIVVRLYEDGSTRIVSINNIDVYSKNIPF